MSYLTSGMYAEEERGKNKIDLKRVKTMGAKSFAERKGEVFESTKVYLPVCILGEVEGGVTVW